MNEDSAIMWQMLLSLYLDNNIKPPKIILKNGVESTYYLMGNHASEFDNPRERIDVLKKFILKIQKTFNVTIKIKPAQILITKKKT